MKRTLSPVFLSEIVKRGDDSNELDELKQDLQLGAGNLTVSSEESCGVAKSKYSQVVETPIHINSIKNPPSSIPCRLVRLNGKQLRAQLLPRKIKHGRLTRIWDPGGHDARMLSRGGKLGRVASQSLDRSECGGVLAVE